MPEQEADILIESSGTQMYEFIEQLFPICRSITGNGVRKTLRAIKEHLPGLEIHEVPTGERCFDWEIPKEWNISDAYVQDENGKKIIDFKEHNLHVLNYSLPVNKEVTLEELDEHLYSFPDKPDVIPYVTSYYQQRWGFCLPHNQRTQLKAGTYRVFIDSSLDVGSLTYADLLIPGATDKEILISTYVCHPSMANNELSGPAVATFLTKWILSQENRKYSYRIVFIPETIGALVYLSRHINDMKANTIAGYILTCVGDNRCYSYMPSRRGDSLADKVALHVLNHKIQSYKAYAFVDRGSDERQYCAPGIDLPVCSVMRSKYGIYPEYHTSDDDLSLVSPDGLQGSIDTHIDIMRILECNDRYVATVLGEPQLSRRNLRPSLGAPRVLGSEYKMISDLLAYADGKLDLIDIANIINVYALDLLPVVETLLKNSLIRLVNEKT